jgi:branched-subunit amino acid ABC-type transport system permease component
MMLSGGLAGLAGAFEISSVVGQLQPQISPGYGFAAIIVAFLGRLNPVGVIFAGLLLGAQLHRRRGGPDSAPDSRQDHPRHPGHPAVLYPGL